MRGQGAAELTGVIGAPIAQSLSPLIHNHWRKVYGVGGVYAPFLVEPATLGAFLDLAPSLGFLGLNVTAPLKEAAFDRVHRRTPTASAMGAVNTIVFDPRDGALGDNTDGYGFLESLAAASGRRDWSGADVLILGAGGAARAVVVALAEKGARRILFSNRTAARAEAVSALAPHIAEVTPWPPAPDAFEGVDLIVNATSLGLDPGADWTWSLPRLAPGVIATDLTYKPLVTPFLAAAAEAGAQIVDGLGMLLYQAQPGFAAWHGVDPAVTPELRRIALEGSGCLP